MSDPQSGSGSYGSPIFRAPPPRKRPAWRTLLWILLAIGAALLLAFLVTPHGDKTAAGGAAGAGAGRHGGGGGGRGGGAGGGRRPPTVVGVATAAIGDIPVQLMALGTVTPEANVIVHTHIAGTLTKVDFQEGQLVHEGQLLAEVDNRPYLIALQQAQGQLLRDQALLADAKLDLTRFKTLLAQDSIASQQVDTQAALVKQDEGTVKTDQAAVASARLNIEYCRIIAPVSGRVGLRQVDAGNYVNIGDTNGVAIITKLDPIDVEFSLPEDNVPQVSARLAAGAVLPATALDRTGATTLAQGTLSTLDNQIDTTTGTIKAKARFANPSGVLYPNQFVNVQLLVDTVKNVVVVPTQAVRHGSNGDYVFTIDIDQAAKMVMVKTGAALGERTAILSGVSAGDQVITDGGDRLTDGAQVILPGQTPPSYGAKKAKPSGLFGWIGGLFGHKPATGAPSSAAAGGDSSAASSAGGGSGGGGGGGGGHGGAGRMAALVATLNLTPDQKPKAAAIFADMRAKMMAAGDDSDARRAAMHDSMAKFNAILTPDQQAKFKAARANMRGGGGGGNGGASSGAAPQSAAAVDSTPSTATPPTPTAPATAAPHGGSGSEMHGGGQGGGGGGDRLARLTAFLGLDATQQTKAAAIFAEAREKAAGASDPDARHAAMAGAMAKLEGILRPDQKAKLDAMRAQRAAEGGGGGQ
jgi:multidrug efflux system membrane fusion protein